MCSPTTKRQVAADADAPVCNFCPRPFTLVARHRVALSLLAEKKKKSRKTRAKKDEDEKAEKCDRFFSFAAVAATLKWL